jgi:Galactosyltransferase
MRLAIRQTWGHFSTRRDIKIAFLVGQSNDDEKIAAENFMYADIIRGKFVDSYVRKLIEKLKNVHFILKN